MHRPLMLAVALFAQSGLAAETPAPAAAASAALVAPVEQPKKITDYTYVELGDKAFTGRFNALIQGWAVNNATTTTKDQNWRLRRSEFKFSGQIAQAPKYFLMVDPAKLIAPPGGKALSADNMFQDFGMSYSPVAGLEFTAGQFKIPTTAEGLDSSAELPLPERSLSGRTFGDKREMGVKAAYKAEMWNVASMLSSGRAVQTNGEGMFHDLDTRAELTPMKNAAIGGFFVMGKDFDYTKKGRFGFNGRTLIDSTIGLRAEVSFGKDTASGKTVDSRGYTTEASYNLTDNLQPVFRFESFTPNTSGSFTGRAQILGVNYFLREYYSKIQVSGAMMQNMSAVNGTPSFTQGLNNADITVVLQTAI